MLLWLASELLGNFSSGHSQKGKPVDKIVTKAQVGISNILLKVIEVQ